MSNRAYNKSLDPRCPSDRASLVEQLTEAHLSATVVVLT